MNRSAQHTALCRDIECALSRLSGILTTANPSGVADYHGARVPYGAFGLGNGAPDILVVVGVPAWTGDADGVVGVLVAIECKTGNARQTPEQRQCQRRLERVGARYVVARCVDDAVRAVGEVRGGHVHGDDRE